MPTIVSLSLAVVILKKDIYLEGVTEICIHRTCCQRRNSIGAQFEFRLEDVACD